MMTPPATKELKRTPLYDRHVALGGRMIDFAGYELPSQYTSIMDEHLWVRSSCGFFDVSHLGEVRVSGPGAFPFLQKMIPTDLGKIGDGGILYTVLLNRQGGVMDDILIYRVNVRTFYLVVNASGIAGNLAHLKAHGAPSVSIQDHSAETACVAVQGPKSAAVCEKLFGGKPARMKYYEFRPFPGPGKTSWISRTGYTGEDGFEIFSDNRTVVTVWDRFVQKGRRLGARPAGLGARNTLRLEAGNGLYGIDLDETTTPFESRLTWLVCETKPDFFGRKMLMERREAGFRNRLCGFRMLSPAVPRDGYPILKAGRKAGRVTSGSYSPTLKRGIGLGYVESAFSNPGSKIEIEIHGRPEPAEIVKLPFVPLKHQGETKWVISQP